MKYTIKNNITKIHRGIASVLLISQLLTSCGFHETILPRIPQAQRASIGEVPIDSDLTSQSIDSTASDKTFPLKTNTIEGIEITFTHTPTTGLQASYKKSDMTEAAPIQQYPIIQTTNGVSKSLRQLTPAEAQLLAHEGKWEVKAGALRYNGMLGRGGMKPINKTTQLPDSKSIQDLRNETADYILENPNNFSEDLFQLR